MGRSAANLFRTVAVVTSCSRDGEGRGIASLTRLVVNRCCHDRKDACCQVTRAEATDMRSVLAAHDNPGGSRDTVLRVMRDA